MRAGRCCLIVTTYIQAHQDLVSHSHVVSTGLIPLTTMEHKSQAKRDVAEPASSYDMQGTRRYHP